MIFRCGKKDLVIGACLLASASLAASRIYDDPVPGGENGYAVTVDGARAVVSDVRNSAMPVNIRWPGHAMEPHLPNFWTDGGKEENVF